MTSLLIFAHGVGGRLDLPLSKWQVAWAGVVALVFSFAALGYFWHRPLLKKLSIGHPIFNALDRSNLFKVVFRCISLFLFSVVVIAGFIGQDNTVANLAPVTVFVVFWIGMACASVLFGHIWKEISPWETLGKSVDRIRKEHDESAPRWLTSGWIALAPISVFHWFELAYHDGASPRILGWWILIYTLGLMGITWKWGWEQARKAEGFGVLFGALAELSPFRVKETEAHNSRKVFIRAPFVGVSNYETSPAQLAIVLAALGGTAFDGFSRTRFWGEIIFGRGKWELTFFNTIGLIWIVAVVGVTYHLAGKLGSRTTGDSRFSERFGASLVPILFGYDLAHYFSLLLLEGQAFKVLISDPFGKGWDIFGTATDPINWTLIPSGAIGWVQVLSIVGGHLVGVLVSHDRGVEKFELKKAMRSQYPMLAVMVLYTLFGLVLMTG